MRHLVWIALALVQARAAEPLRLVTAGRSDYSIALRADATPAEKRGAEELQRFLEQISGARLPIVSGAGRQSGPRIRVGDPAFDALGAEAFAIKTSGRDLIIAGGRARGTMYGVYAFLDKLGCRWFTRDVSRIPSLRTITFGPIDEVEKPAFEYREPFFAEAFDKNWAARNKMNGAHTKLDASTGGKLEYFPFVHSFNQLIPPAKYFQEHPEYFSLVDGKRRAERTQLCLTNPDVLRLGVASVLEWIEQHPEATIYSVSQNDWTNWCECDNCRRVEQEEGGAHSGPLLRYVNALAAEVEKKHPDKLIDTLAYWYTEDPPAKTRPRPNVRIRLCPIGACEAHPYEQCPYNAYFMKNLRAWAKITGQLYIWHYNTNFSHFLLPFPDFDELAADLPMYRRNGVVGVFLEGSPAAAGGAENAELRSYIMARLLWDTRADVARDVREFHEAYYGKAAPPMLEYFELMHQQVRRGPHLWIFQNPRSPYVTREFLDRAAKLFARAEALADTDATRRRVRKARLAIDYTELMWSKQFTVRGGWFAPADLDGLKSRWSALLDTLRGFGITNLREHTTLDPDDAQFRRMMRPYRVATMENARLRLDVAPELAGRAIRMIDKSSGRQLLFEGDPGAPQYPELGGLAAFAYPDFVSRTPFAAAWEISAAGADGIELRGRCENGLTLRRSLKLRGGDPVLYTETVAENAGKKPVELALQSRIEMDAGDLRQAALRLRDGERRFENSAGNETLEPGEWTLLRGGRPLVRSQAPNGQAARMALSWSVKGENRVTMTLWSPQRTLAPGERLRLDAEYGW